MKKRKAAIFFKPMEGTGPLSLYFFDGFLGDAIEAKNEAGVGWFSPNGELLAVRFDEVSASKDHQMLEFQRFRVVVDIKKGKSSYSVTELHPHPEMSR